jgi:hypothetical protein
VQSTPRDRRTCVFLRFWTLKEAFIKATGEGLRRPLNSFSFTFDRFESYSIRSVRRNRFGTIRWRGNLLNSTQRETGFWPSQFSGHTFAGCVLTHMPCNPRRSCRARNAEMAFQAEPLVRIVTLDRPRTDAAPFSPSACKWGVLTLTLCAWP